MSAPTMTWPGTLTSSTTDPSQTIAKQANTKLAGLLYYRRERYQDVASNPTYGGLGMTRSSYSGIDASHLALGQAHIIDFTGQSGNVMQWDGAYGNNAISAFTLEHADLPIERVSLNHYDNPTAEVSLELPTDYDVKVIVNGITNVSNQANQWQSPAVSTGETVTEHFDGGMSQLGYLSAMFMSFSHDAADGAATFTVTPASGNNGKHHLIIAVYGVAAPSGRKKRAPLFVF